MGVSGKSGISHSAITEFGSIEQEEPRGGRFGSGRPSPGLTPSSSRGRFAADDFEERDDFGGFGNRYRNRQDCIKKSETSTFYFTPQLEIVFQELRWWFWRSFSLPERSFWQRFWRFQLGEGVRSSENHVQYRFQIRKFLQKWMEQQRRPDPQEVGYQPWTNFRKHLPRSSFHYLI